MKKAALQILVIIEAILFLLQAPLFGQPTQPSTATATRPAYAPPPRPVYAPPPRKAFPAHSITIGVGSQRDISADLINAKDNTGVLILPGVIAHVHGSPVITARNLSIIGGAGSKLVSDTPGAGLTIRGEGFDVENLWVSAPAGSSAFFRIQAPYVHQKNVWNAAKIGYMAIIDGPNEDGATPGLGGAYFLSEGCGQLVPTNADFYYTNGADYVTIAGVRIQHTVGEQGLRFDSDRGGHPANHFAVIGGTIVSNSPLNKSCISVREGNGTIDRVTMYGYVRTGQQSGDPASVRVAIINCTFFRDSTGINNILCMAATVWADHNTFYLPGSQRAMGSMQGIGQIASAEGNIKIAVPKGAATKPLQVVTEQTARGDVYHESNGTHTISK